MCHAAYLYSSCKIPLPSLELIRFCVILNVWCFSFQTLFYIYYSSSSLLNHSSRSSGDADLAPG